MEAGAFTEPVAPPNGEPPAAPEVEEWRKDKTGKQWVPRKDGRPGRITRQGEESIEQARKRDSTPADERRPRRKAAKPPKGPAPTKPDLKLLEQTIGEALKAPAVVAAAFGDDWAAEHFTRSGPYLARNLVNASAHNPWLRRKLEEAATGEDAMMKIVGLLGVAGGLVWYFVPPTIYFLNLPVPEKTREMFHVPPRREPEPQEQHGPPLAESDQAAYAAAAT